MFLRFAAIIASATLVFGQADAPAFRAEDVRPQGAAEPHQLAPGLGVWIFGANLAASPGCAASNLMEPATYRTELCGTRVLIGGIEAKLLFVSPAQINLIAPDHPWENELVPVQVIHDGAASAPTLVRFGWNHPVISVAEPAQAGMPVWLRVEKPYGKGWLRYPFHLEPWDFGGSTIEVRFEGAALEALPFAARGFYPGGMIIGLPRDVPREYMDRLPLHLLYRLDRPGTYQVRYTDYRYKPGSAQPVVDQQSDWTSIEILPVSSPKSVREAPPRDTVDLLCDYLPNLLAGRDAATLLTLAPFLESRDPLVRQYAGYALSYFDPALLARLLPGKQPLRGDVR